MLVTMLLVAGGRFTAGAVGSTQMLPGEEGRQHHTVRAFYLDATEVTQAAWAELMGENPVATRQGKSAVNPNLRGPACSVAGVGDELPVVCVSWDEVLAYANARSEREGLAPAYVQKGGIWIWDRDAPGYRLPTHVEWERAARGSLRETYGRWDDPYEACEAGAVLGEVCSEDHAEPVGEQAEGPYGHRGLYGNVREWVWFDTLLASQTELLEHRAPGFSYLTKGGSWASRRDEARVSSRAWTWRGSWHLDVGVRLARNP